jgi:4-amino-4-deoxy-L-arabinose transferase-like glycosyltransferase
MARARHRRTAPARPPVAQSAPAAPQPAWLTWLPWILVFLFYIVIRVQLIGVPLDRDEGAFGYAGQAILRGEMPYRDFFDHKPPGLLYLYAAVMLFVPPTAAGVHAFLLAWNLLALAALAFVAWKLAGRRAALWTAFVYSVVSVAPSVQGFTASAELIAIAPLAASLALAFAPRRRGLMMILAGVLAAFVFLIKPPYALPLLATPLLLRAQGERWKRDTAMWVAGGATIGVLVAVAFAGVWKEFWYWNATHNTVYRNLSWDGWRERFAVVLGHLMRDLFVPFALAAVGCVWAIAKRVRYAWFLTAFFVLSAISCIQAGYFYLHYFAQIVAALALAAGIGAAAALDRAPAPRLSAAALAALILIIPAVAKPWYWITPNPIEVTLRQLGSQAFEASPLIAGYLRERTGPDDAVWVYGSEPQIAFQAERKNANPYVMMYPVTLPFPRQSEFQRRTWERVQAMQPAYIVLAKPKSLLPRTPGMDTFLDERLESIEPSYPLESCLSLMPGEGLVLNTTLRNGECPGQDIIEIRRRAGTSPG